MTLDLVLTIIKQRSIELSVKNGQVIYRAPRGAMTDEIREILQKHKSQLLQQLGQPKEKEDCRQPYISSRGTLVVPFNSDPKYHWWAGGQSVQKTLKEIGAPPEVMAKYTDGGTA